MYIFFVVTEIPLSCISFLCFQQRLARFCFLGLDYAISRLFFSTELVESLCKDARADDLPGTYYSQLGDFKVNFERFER